MHDRQLGLGRQRLLVTAHGREIAQPGLKPLGDRDLSGRAAKDDLAGEVDPLSGQRVYNVVPCPRLGRIERLWRFRAASAGTIGTMFRSAAGRLAMAGELTPIRLYLKVRTAPKWTNPTAKALK